MKGRLWRTPSACWCELQLALLGPWAQAHGSTLSSNPDWNWLISRRGAGLYPAADLQSAGRLEKPPQAESLPHKRQPGYRFLWDSRSGSRVLRRAPRLLYILCAALTGSAHAATPYDCQGLSALGHWQDANNCYRDLVASEPTNPDYRVAWGRLFEKRYNPAEATKLFQEALKIDPKNAGAYVGLALVASNDFDIKAVEFAKRALELDPKLTEAQELLARLALEDNDESLAHRSGKQSVEACPAIS